MGHPFPAQELLVFKNRPKSSHNLPEDTGVEASAITLRVTEGFEYLFDETVPRPMQGSKGLRG